jgi:hypothetical protein
MGFNRRKMEDRRRQAAEQEAAARRATEKQILEDADHLITVWNERQAKRMPMLFSPTIGAGITAGRYQVYARIEGPSDGGGKTKATSARSNFGAISILHLLWCHGRNY